MAPQSQGQGTVSDVTNATATAIPNDTMSPAAGTGGIIFEDGDAAYCIGGTLCPDYCAQPDISCEPVPSYTIRLDAPTHISRIQVFAHDQIGETRRADLIVRVNGEIVDRQPVYRRGALVSLDVGRTGQLVTIEAQHSQKGLEDGGDEAVIRDVFVFSDSTVEQ